jgi:hypothetical protein
MLVAFKKSSLLDSFFKKKRKKKKEVNIIEWFPPELELLKFPSGNRPFI